jgi:hypothetical protein
MRTISTIFLCAALIGLGVPSTHASAATLTACVHNPTELNAALLAAQTNTGLNLVKVVRGTYDTAGTAFSFFSAIAGQLDIGGGYNDDCSVRIENPALTIFDGGSASPVLNLQNTSGIQVRFLTIQNGYTTTDTGAGLFALSTNGDVTINYNIIRNNQSYTAGGLYAKISGASATGTIEVDGNLICGNSASGYSGGGDLLNSGLGDTNATNNTIAGNSETLTGGAGALSISVVSTQTNLSNNIFWDNTGGYDILFNGVDEGVDVLLVNNDYSAISGTPAAASSANVNVDPQFVTSTNFQLSATSPLLGQGTTSPIGGLPSIDLVGNPRTYNATTDTVDMGAYERGDEIFTDGLGG